MTLRDQIARTPETLADMDAACAFRWREGDRLLTAGEHNGAVYLLGYVVEMRVKLAAFRRTSTRPTDRVDTLRRTVGAWMRTRSPGIDAEGGHSLVYWTTYLQLQGRGVDKSLTRGIRRHVLATAFHGWKVEMRYRDARRVYDDAWRIWIAAWWLEEHWIHL
jgi:hypothetical protein